ncbi:hypothetical protein C8D97_103153 [Pleionea mediterranea]|uniref:Uncharacterized protein n=1 Tax=Pleionea mediterranea TaxID=523701 RepID=A0A316G039_9GAMM|nr:hypothetical protein C8D97_103153 [Pleionea mediterranea]
MALLTYGEEFSFYCSPVCVYSLLHPEVGGLQFNLAGDSVVLHSNINYSSWLLLSKLNAECC